MVGSDLGQFPALWMVCTLGLLILYIRLSYIVEVRLEEVTLQDPLAHAQKWLRPDMTPLLHSYNVRLTVRLVSWLILEGLTRSFKLEFPFLCRTVRSVADLGHFAAEVDGCPSDKCLFSFVRPEDLRHPAGNDPVNQEALEELFGLDRAALMAQRQAPRACMHQNTCFCI